MRRVFLEIFFGVILFLFSYFLAIYLKYSRFYTILLLGLLFILKGTYHLRKKEEFLNSRKFLVLYPVFFILGIFFDLVIGLWITKLWYYPNYNLLDYFNLYLIIYPLGAFVMIYSFALIEAIFVHRPKPSKIAYEHSVKISLIFFIFGALAFTLSLIFVDNYKGFYGLTFFVISIGGLIDYFVLRINKNNLLERFSIKALKYGILILGISYIQGIIHEWPNIYAREWIYQNWPLQEITFLGIPATILFFGWIFLLIGPYTIFELIMTFLRRLNLRK